VLPASGAGASLSSKGTIMEETQTARERFVARLRAADCSWDQSILIALARSAANEIERLIEIINSQKAEINGLNDNRFYDQRDGYFEGLADGQRGCPQ
jgi:hypothetical protein